MGSALNKAVDVKAALVSGGAGNISVFVADDDTFTIGHAASFGAMEIIVGTGASGAGISPVFEYSTGVAMWASFSPADGTNSFKNTGVIEWDVTDLAGFAIGTGSEFLIRITRTRNSLATTPIIDEVQISALTEFVWDSSGDLTANEITLTNPLPEASGGTHQSTYTTGDILYASGANTLSKLAATASGEVLTSQGVGVAPAYAAAAGGGVVLQQVRTSTSALIPLVTAIPYDDTIPQITEGTQILSLAITPTASDSVLVVEAKCPVSTSGAPNLAEISIAIFRGSTASAVAAGMALQGNTENQDLAVMCALNHFESSASTDATSFQFRVGGATTNDGDVNGEGNARLYGGTASSTLIITEYSA